MRKSLKTLIWGYLHVQYAFLKWTGTGAFGRKKAQFIDSVKNTNGNTLKKALVRHHVKQYHEASCSVASVVSLVNAVSDVRKKLNGAPISQLEILDKVKAAHWKQRMEPEGHNGRRGLPLKVLGDVVKSSFEAYDLAYQEIAVVQATNESGEALKVKEKLRLRLMEFEKNGGGLIVAHFNQGVYVQALQIPHISPVGGYDAATDMVTILDVDFLQKKHYQISFDRFYEGLASNYNYLFRGFGFDSGGYVYVKLI